MKLTSVLFAAYLKCPTKCYLRSTGQTGAGNAYADWVREQNDAYQREGVQRLVTAAEGEVAVTTPGAANLKTATWRLAADLPLETETMASRLHAVERVPSEGRGKPAQFIPVRFVFWNKLTKDDRLLVAFDALVLSETLGREVSAGKVIHGDNHGTLKVKVASLLGTVRKLTGKMSALLTGGSPPDLILNRHCGECEFRDGCRQKAMEKDDLSLLGGMSAKERQKLRSKGIFTVTQLSYTFRPRRRPKRFRDKREKYHHSLKALAIREKKIHIVGTPELKIDGTPVYLDVEGIPDRDFYYLIGVRVGNGESAVQHSLWADTVEDEENIWREFLAILETVEKPVLIHYGSYETTFFKKMIERYKSPSAESTGAARIGAALNLLSLIFARVYFPTHSNGLKEVAAWYGFKWGDSNPSGLKTVKWRHEWEETTRLHPKCSLVSYNTDDCRALELVVRIVMDIAQASPIRVLGSDVQSVVNIDGLEPQCTMWPKFSSPVNEFEIVNRAARWDYQRSRVYVRTSKRIRQANPIGIRQRRAPPKPQKRGFASSILQRPLCPYCKKEAVAKPKPAAKLLHNILFGRFSLKAQIVEYSFSAHWCHNCHLQFGEPEEFWPKSKYGRNFVAFLVYFVIGLFVTQSALRKILDRFFGYDLNAGTINRLKSWAAHFYAATRDHILENILHGNLVHVDETRAIVKGRAAYVWVFASLHEVAYYYADSREGDVLRSKLSGFQGVLVSDFYSAYDSVACPQQKCLIHLIRDLNTELLNHPYDCELERTIRAFAELLKIVIDTVDRHGLKRHYLRKHLRACLKTPKRFL